MISIYIEYEARPGRFDELLARLREESQACIDEDEGCLRMELGVPEAAAGWVTLSELWRDPQALEDHKNKPGHSHAWQEPLVASKRVRVSTVFASPAKPATPRG